MKGMIFDIKRFAIHDGPGIRTTVFFKGCSLRCQWCHNPEGQEPKPEIAIRESRCQQECRECLSACPKGAISKNEKTALIDRAKCDLCGKCRDVCVYEALEVIGREVTVDEVVEEVEKDRVFFDESNGGITFSGGEPLMQPDFLEALLERFKKQGVRQTVDTSGYAPFETLERVSRNADLFLYDIKLMDEKKHKEYTGVSNQIILDNLKKLAEKEKKIVIRIPVVPGINDDRENIQKTAEYLLSLKEIKYINLLPFHRGGADKAERLGKKSLAGSIPSPAAEKMEEIRKTLSNFGFLLEKGEK
jgi:pyruvate formate lyase activating enzyme